MYTYQLDGQPIAPPTGADGLTLTRSRHRQYWGFFHRRETMVQGQANLRFSEPTAIRVLEAGFAALAPATTLSIDTPGFRYAAQIDYDTYVRTGEGVTVGLKGGSAADTLAAMANTVFDLPLTESFNRSSLGLGGTQSLAMPSDAAGRSVTSRGTSSGIPFKGLGDASLPTVIYKNTSTSPATLKLSGVVQLTLPGIGTYTLVANGKTLLSRVVTTPLVQGLINATIQLAAGESLTLSVTSPAGTLVYDPATTLTLTEQPDVTSSLAVGISLAGALRKLLDNMGLSAMPISSAWLAEFGGGKLTSAAGLAGATGATLSLSLSGWLSNATLLHFLKTGLTETGQLSIERRSAAEASTSIAYRDLRSLSVKRGTDYVYGSITAGYPAPADTAQRLTDSYRQRSYVTGVSSRNELQLTPSWLCDPDRIEQARRGLLSQSADKNREIYYLPAGSDDLSAEGIRSRWVSWYTYTRLPELHTLTLVADQNRCLTLTDVVTYESANGGTITGEVLDSAYSETDKRLTLTLLVR